MAKEVIRHDGDRRRGRADLAAIDATTEEEIHEHLTEDGFDPADPMAGLVETLSPAEIRRRVGLTQTRMAEHLRIPVSTWRNWEQERTTLDPATRSFLDIVANDTERTFRAIAGRPLAENSDGQLDRMMQVNDAQFLVAYAKKIAESSKRGLLSEAPIPNESARLRRLRRDPEYAKVVALLDRIIGL